MSPGQQSSLAKEPVASCPTHTLVVLPVESAIKTYLHDVSQTLQQTSSSSVTLTSDLARISILRVSFSLMVPGMWFLEYLLRVVNTQTTEHRQCLQIQNTSSDNLKLVGCCSVFAW